MLMIKKLLVLLIFLVFLGVTTFGVGFVYISKNIPDIRSLDDYRPNIPTRIYDRHGVLLRKIGPENREIVAIEEIPEIVLNAFLAAEDSSFFHHSGVDFFGIARAFVANLKAGKVVQGGSTITQQVAKSFLDNKERSIVRKLKDMVLAYKLETHLSKEDILFLYLNQVYLGGGYYGVKAAFKGYFGKELSEVTSAEAAMVAGLLVAPSKYSPYRNPKYAYARQSYVLKRLFENGMITQNEYNEAKVENIKYFQEPVSPEFSFHFEEKVRQDLLLFFSEEELKNSGLEVVTTLDFNLQKVAQQSVDDGLVDIDKRQGFDSENIKVLEIDSIEKENKRLVEKIIKHESSFFTIDKKSFNRVYEFDRLSSQGSGSLRELIVSFMKKKKFLAAIVKNVEQTNLVVDIAGEAFEIPLEGAKWAKQRSIDSSPSWRSPVDDLRNVFKPGMQVNVRLENDAIDGKVVLSLFQYPKVQGSAVAIDPDSNEVLAMVGGSSFVNSHFNRALQSLRQPGSAFKPFVYAAAIKYGFTPSSIIIDSPESLDAGAHNINWKPRNYDGKYLGPITLRTSLEKSRNVTTIKLARSIGVSFLSSFLEEMGFNFKDKKDLSVVLGSQGITLFDLVKRYSYFLKESVNKDANYILSVKDYKGNDYTEKFRVSPSSIMPETEDPSSFTELDDTEVEEEKNKYRMNKRESYIVRNLLRGVIQNGTGRKAKNISKQIGGKTGTTSDYIDAWFVGFSSDLVAGIFVGFDDPRPLGYKETGSSVAAPIFRDFMKKVLDNTPDLPFRRPAGIKLISVNPRTGLKVSSNQKGSILEAFKPGQLPNLNYDKRKTDIKNTQKNLSPLY